MMKLPKNKKILVQHNDVTLAKYSPMSAYEFRVIYSVMNELRSDDPFDKEYSVNVADIFSSAGDSEKYSRYEEAVKSLANKHIEIREGKTYTVINVFDRITYERGRIRATLAPSIRPYLFSLKSNFTTFDFEEAMRLSNGTTHRIFQIVNYFKNFKYQDCSISIDDFKEKLDMENLYEQNKELKRRVLQPAKQEIEEKTSLKFDYALTNPEGGKKMTHVSFNNIRIERSDEELVLPRNTSRSKKTTTAANKSAQQSMTVVHGTLVMSDHDQDKRSRMLERLQELGLSKSQISKVCQINNVHNDSRLWKTINETKLAHQDGKIVGSIGGYFAKRLELALEVELFAKSAAKAKNTEEESK